MREAPIPPGDGSDAAWVRVPTLLSPDEVRSCLDDTEFVFRLNPYYHFKNFRPIGPASFRAEFKNESNEQDVNLGFSVERESPHLLTLRYDGGLKDRTVFSIEPASGGAVLTIADFYDRLPAEERTSRMAEVDRSLPAWGNALLVYFRRRRRWSWLPGWRRYLHGPWMRMTPRARRIVWLLWLISLAEFAFFLFVLLIYVLEHRRAV